MFVYTGFYKLRKRVTGYRRNYCGSCKKNQTIFRIRFFPVLHIWFVPLLPLFYGVGWACEECENSDERTGAWFVWSIAFLLVAIGSLFIGNSFVDATDEDSKLFLVVGSSLVGGAILVGLSAIYVGRRNRRLSNETREQFHQEFLEREATCWVCGGDLLLKPNLHCGECSARVHTKLEPDFLREIIAKKH
jgi:hypothetical protein